MVTRNERLDDFITNPLPQPSLQVKILAEDHVGTYTLPFACEYTGGSWLNASTGEAIMANVIGWRELGTGSRDQDP
jgi:hypothetical protein